MSKIRCAFVSAVFLCLLLSPAMRTFCGEEQGDRFFEEKKYRKAIQEYEQAAKSGVETESLIVKLGKSYDSLNWYGQSVQYWEKYLQKFPGGKEAGYAKKRAGAARRWLALNFYNLGEDLDVVIHQLELATGHDPALNDAYYWLGRVCIEDGKFDMAVSALEKLVSLSPEDKKARWLLKEARGMMEFGGKAYSAYTAGYDFYEKGDPDAAIEKYLEAAGQNPKFVNAFVWVARIYFEKERYGEAVPYWKKVLELQPDNKRAEWFLKLSKRRDKEKKAGAG